MKTSLRILPLILLVIGLSLSGCAAEKPREGGDSGNVLGALTEINEKIDEMVLAAQQGDYARAERERLEAYGVYETHLEAFLDSRDKNLAHTIEGILKEGSAGNPGLAALIAAKASPTRIEASAAHLSDELQEVRPYTTSSLTATVIAFNSATIILREGLEAVLIIGVILGYMKATKRDSKYASWVFIGVGAALVLSLVTWWASLYLLDISSLSRAVLEGVTSLVAVAVLFYVTNWLFHKAYVVDWMSFIKSEAGKALATGSAVGLVGLGFTVVYREGFETVLFYQALLFNADPAPVWLGLIAGTALLIIIAIAVLKLSVKLPIKPFFSVTGLLLLLLAFKLMGVGIHEFQEAGMISMTLWPAIPENDFLQQVFGIYPTAETILSQVVMLLALGVTFTISRWSWRRSGTVIEGAS